MDNVLLPPTLALLSALLEEIQVLIPVLPFFFGQHVDRDRLLQTYRTSLL